MNLYGIQFYQGTYKEAVQSSLKIKQGYFCFVNSHMVYEHHKNQDFKDILGNSEYNFPDGMPLTYSIRFFKGNKQERIAGNDMLYSLIEKAHIENLSIFFIGSTEKILKLISDKMVILGVRHKVFSPPFKSVEQFDFEYQSVLINSYNPDMVLVGLGCPKQEIWMYKMRDKIRVPMYGLGGAFILYAGLDNRAPKWMRDIGMEWFYRLLLEPRRLFKRYLITNTFFLWLLIKEIFKSKISTKSL